MKTIDLLKAHFAATLAILPVKDCPNCFYRQDELRDGGKLHCYMFKDEPPGDKCAQFRTLSQTAK